MNSATTITPTIYEAAKIMVEQDIECLLVSNDKRLAGLISRMDLLCELAKQ